MKYILIAFVLLISAQITLACSCSTLGKLTIKDYNEQTTIFIGKVKNVRLVEDASGYSQNEMLFEIISTFKGVIGKREVKVFTNSSSFACGLTVSKGQTWLLYANALDNKLTTSICSRSSNIAHTKASDLQLLKTFAAGKVTLWRTGTVLRGEGKLEHQLPVGKWKYYHGNGFIAEEGTYANGKKEGRWLKYLDVEQLMLQLQSAKDKLPKNVSLNKADYRHHLETVSDFRGGERHGAFIEYHPINLKMTRVISYANGEQDGLSINYFNSGLIDGTYQYVKGKLNGPSRVYYENGQLMCEGLYDNGNPGTFKVYDEQGKLIGNSVGPPNYDSETKKMALIKN